MITNRKASKLFRRVALMLLLALAASSPAWAQKVANNKFVMSYMPDPRFNIPNSERNSYGYYDDEIPRCQPTRVQVWAPKYKGYTFRDFWAYWIKDDGSFAYDWYHEGDTIPESITCHISSSYPFMVMQAEFDTNHFTVSFDANGGTGTSMADLPMQYDKTYTLPACTFSKGGHTLMGWTTKADGSGDFFYDGETVRNINAVPDTVITLYAQWNLGDGSPDNPWLVDSSNWDVLAARVNKGVDSYKYYKMTSNVTVLEQSSARIPNSRMMGTEDHPFTGYFDGDGHSLKLNVTYYNNIRGAYAPFYAVGQSTFVNLILSGHCSFMNSNDDPAYVSVGGCVVVVLSGCTATFVACRSSLTSTHSYGGSFGGYIAAMRYNSNAVFVDCFSNAEAWWDPEQVAYFIGIPAECNVTFNNCLDATPTYHYFLGRAAQNPEYQPPQYPFVCRTDGAGQGSRYTYNNCWRRMTDESCQRHNGGLQGSYTATTAGEAFRATLGNGWVLDGTGNVTPRMPATTHGITVGDITHGTVKCLETAAAGVSVMLEVTPEEGYHVVSVTYNDGSSHDATLHDGKYWFTMSASDVNVSATFAVDNNAVPYVAYNTETRTYETRYFAADNVSNVTSSSTTLGDSACVRKYVVTGSVTVSERIYVNGTVHLVLADDATLTATKGINVHTGNSLIVYGQEGGTGILNATGCRIMGGSQWESAAIGSDGNGNGSVNARLGNITFHSGVVNATGIDNTAGVGGGIYSPVDGSITIYGGTVSAITSNANNWQNPAEAIGRGAGGDNVGKTIADGLRVYTHNSTTPWLIEYPYRLQNGLSHTDVRVERCTEHNYQNGRCTYCGAWQYHQITYYGNGNTGGTAPSVATCNVTMGIHEATGTIAEVGTLERTGYTFTGWNTEADGSGTAYAPGATITLTNSITLYAQWNIITYNISYDLAGGTESLIPNPTSYSILNWEIILKNPTRLEYDENNNPIYYFFRGWTGTGLEEATMRVVIPQGSMGDRTYTATWEVNPSPYPGVDVDNDFQPGEVGYFYVRMAREDDVTEESPVVNPKVVNIPEELSSGFKVYDDGGKNNRYSDFDYGNTLTLSCPEGYTFHVQGIIDIDGEDDGQLTIYDGIYNDENSECAKLLDAASGRRNIGPVFSSGNNISFFLAFGYNQWWYTGFDLTVTLVPPPSAINMVNDDSQLETKNTSVIATNDGERANVTIDGYTLYKDETWNTLCLPFDILDINSSSVLKNAIVKQPASIEMSESGVMTMNFTDATSIEAGKPYIVRWNWDRRPICSVISGADGLVDGYRTSEWRPWWNYVCEFVMPGSLEITDYTVTTATHLVVQWHDRVDYNYHNPKAWTLEGKLNADDEWTLIDSRDSTVNPDDALPMANTADKNYSVANPGTYRYFRYTVTNGNSSTELGELTLHGTFTPATPAPIQNPVFNSATIKDELNPMASGLLSFEGDYSSLASTDGLLLDAHNADANAFRATLRLPDRPWYTDAELTTLATTIPFDPTTGNVVLYTQADDLPLTLANDDSNEPVSNNELITAKNGEFSIVTLADRTLSIGGSWNTLCLPFSLASFSGTPLEGATVKTVTSMVYDDENRSLTMNFSDNLTSIEAGKPYIVKYDLNLPILIASDDVFPMIDFITVTPDIDSGQTSLWNEYAENYDKLLDGDINTKYGTNGQGYHNSPYVVFHYPDAITPTGYALWTANDEEGRRNPTSWTISAKAEANDNWTTLVTVDNLSGNMLPMANNTCSLFDLNNSTAYEYFKFEATCAGNDQFQLAELQFFTVRANVDADIENLVFSSVIVESESNPVADNNFRFAGNYSSLGSTNGLLLDAHNDGGKALHCTLGSNRDGYKVSGWYTNAEMTTPATSIPFDPATGNVTLYVTWGIADYTITYNLGGGSVATANPTTYTAETSTFTLTNPTRDNYIFIGWSGTGIEETSYTVTVEQGSSGDRTYTAVWVPVNYSITYNVMTDSTLVSFYTIESGDITLSTPSRSAYTFSGWYLNEGLTGDAVTTIADGSTGNKVFWAKWTPLDYYIGYHVNDGTMPDSYATTYNIESAATNLPQPAREGYTFAGWYDNENLSGDAVTAIAAGSAGFKEFWAKWHKELTITANSDNKIYDGTALTNNGYTVTGLLEGDLLTANVTITGSQTNVGTSDNVVTAVENVSIRRNEEDVTADYAIVTENGTLTVTPKAVTVTAADQSKNYGEADPSLTTTATGLVGEDAVAYTVSRTAGEDVGTYAITPTGETAQGNYAVTYVPGTLTVNPVSAIVTITGHNSTVTYDGEEHSVSGYGVSISPDLYTESDFTFSGNASAARTDAGTTNMGLSASDFTNTNDNFENVTFNVTDGYQTVTAKVVDNPIIILGQTEYTYDGNAHTPTVTVLDGETPIPDAEYNVSYSDNTEVGTATVTVTDNDDGNYTVSGSATFLINATYSVNIAAGGWQAISSPVHNSGNDETVTGVDNLTTGDYDMFRYNEETATWENQKHSEVSGHESEGFNVMEQGRGYIYRRSESTTLVYRGFPNSGTGYDLSWSCGDAALKGFNLIGNPYPHAISSNDISVTTGALATGYYTLNHDGTWLAHTSGSISTGEAILVQSTTATTISFSDNGGGGGKGGQDSWNSLVFTVTDGTHSDVAYAILEGGNGLAKIGHMTSDAPMLGIPVEGRRYAIAMLGDTTDAFVLDFSGKAGEYTLTVNSEELRDKSYLHLIDRVAGREIDLLKGNIYRFTVDGVSSAASRFVVRLSPNSEPGTRSTFAWQVGENIVVEGTGTLQAYDLIGRLLFSRDIQNSKFEIQNSSFPGTGVYVLRLGEQSQKIVITR